MTLSARLSRRTGGAILHLDGLSVPERIRLFGEDWPAKSEFHVTLIGKDLLVSLLRDIGRLKIIQAEVAISRAAAEIGWNVRLREEWWRLDDGDERTIIQLVDVEGAETFFTNLETALDTTIERPPYHVTLYTIHSSRGIGVATQADLQRLGRRIDGPELDALRRQLQSGGA